MAGFVPCLLYFGCTCTCTHAHMYARMHLHTHTQLEMVGFVPCLLYFGYMCIASFLFVLMTGTIGFFASWWFVWKIFAAVKVD